MSINFRKLKELITENHIVRILHELGSEVAHRNEKEIIFYSCCHHLDCQNHKPKLYYYMESRSFYCYSCGTAFDIISLVQARWTLENRNFTFMEIIYYIMSMAGIEQDSVKRLAPVIKTNTPWQQILGKYQHLETTVNNMKEWDKRILATFPVYYPLEWLEEGIGIEAMEQHHICYYPLKNQTLIPCYDMNNALVGIRVRNWDSQHTAKYSSLKTVEQFANTVCIKQPDSGWTLGTDFKFSTNQVLYGLNVNRFNIESRKKVVLVESEKAVLKSYTWYGHKSLTVGMFGNHLNLLRRNMLLDLGIDEVIIVPDYDYHEVDTPEYKRWMNTNLKLAQLFKGHCRVTILVDDDHLIPYKDNAFDVSKETYEKLYQNRIDVYD